MFYGNLAYARSGGSHYEWLLCVLRRVTALMAQARVSWCSPWWSCSCCGFSPGFPQIDSSWGISPRSAVPDRNTASAFYTTPIRCHIPYQKSVPVKQTNIRYKLQTWRLIRTHFIDIWLKLVILYIYYYINYWTDLLRNPCIYSCLPFTNLEKNWFSSS